MGIAVRPARRRARQEPRSAHALDHRRSRRRRLDPDPARAAADRPHGGRHCDAPGIAKVVPRSRRTCGDRSQQADEGADRGAKTAAGRPRRQPHLHRPALQGDRRIDGAAGQVRPNRRSPGIHHERVQGQGDLGTLGIHVHPLLIPDRGHDRAAPSVERRRRPPRQGRAAHHARPDVRHHQRRQPQARACTAESGKSRGKIVLEGW
jgi:hypothetical protein